MAPPNTPPAAPQPDASPVDYIIGCHLAVLAGALVALSMVINRYSLAHATTHRIRCIPFVVQPWMVWIFAMIIYNIGATALASVAQLYIPLSLFAVLFVTLLVVNLVLARWMLGEKVTPPKVSGALIILAGAAMAAVGTPTDRVALQDSYPCTDGLPCVGDHVADLAKAPAAVALYTSLAAITITSVISIIIMECKYPAADLKRTAPSFGSAAERHPKLEVLQTTPTPAARLAHDDSLPSSHARSVTSSMPETESASLEAATPASLVRDDVAVGSMNSSSSKSFLPERWLAYILCTEGTPADQPPSLAPWWLERVMAFVYPFSMGVDEGIAHLFLRAEVAMNTQCNLGGCSSAAFIVSAAVRWSCSLATSFWLIVVFRRYEVSISLPIEYGTATVINVISGLVFHREYEEIFTSLFTN